MNVSGVVVDLDGTVYRGQELLSGAPEAIQELRNRGVGTLFVTNNATRDRASYVEHLAEFGIESTYEEILSAGTVTAEYLADRHAGDQVFLVGSTGLRDQLVAHDVRLTDDPDDADVVVTSHTYGFDYESMTQGLWALDTADAFYGTDPDLTYPEADGRRYPGSGAITRAVAGVAEREPDQVFGKPSGPMVELVSETLHCEPSECLIVGDGLDTDIAMGELAGMTTVLVLSGRTSRAAAESADVTPDHVVESLADVPALL